MRGLQSLGRCTAGRKTDISLSLHPLITLFIYLTSSVKCPVKLARDELCVFFFCNNNTTIHMSQAYIHNPQNSSLLT
jgi:hypothetical protein